MFLNRARNDRLTAKLALILAAFVAASVGQFFWVSLASADAGLTDTAFTDESPTETPLPLEPVGTMAGSPAQVEGLGSTPESVVQTADQTPDQIADASEPVTEDARGPVEAATQTVSSVTEPVIAGIEPAEEALGSVTAPALAAVEPALASAEASGPIAGLAGVELLAEATDSNATESVTGSASDSSPAVELIMRIDLNRGANLSSQVVRSAETTLEAIPDQPHPGRTDIGHMEPAQHVTHVSSPEPLMLVRDRDNQGPEARASIPGDLWASQYTPSIPAKSPARVGSPSPLALEPAGQASGGSGSRIDWPDPVWAGLLVGLLAAGIILALPTSEARPRTLRLRPTTPPA